MMKYEKNAPLYMDRGTQKNSGPSRRPLTICRGEGHLKFFQVSFLKPWPLLEICEYNPPLPLIDDVIFWRISETPDNYWNTSSPPPTLMGLNEEVCGNMKKYVENMKKYVELCKASRRMLLSPHMKTLGFWKIPSSAPI